MPARLFACRGAELAHLVEFAPDRWCQASELSLLRDATIRTLYRITVPVNNPINYTAVRDCRDRNVSLSTFELHAILLWPTRETHWAIFLNSPHLCPLLILI